ncbi:mRNA-capping enzyme-like [Daphnia carinata]|uniref:mRNA-capping enzyme-like n=1 Tax=Daphnia carinata TaxID=120202 RepID=UPI0025798499|nr:mRNA-capping enzyme-like [Daphnia carinata]
MELRRPLSNRNQTTNWRLLENSRNFPHRPPSSEKRNFTRINLDTKFYEGQDVEGIHLLTDFDYVRQLQMRLGRFADGPEDFFPANWPVSLSMENISKLTPSQYVVAPKPTGPRFLLYVDSSGDMFLENMTQHIFRVDEDHAVKMNSFDGRPITDTVLDGVFCKEKRNRDDNCSGGEESSEKLTFVIRDAIRCEGLKLTDMGIMERIDFVKEGIMKPRLYALKNSKESNENEAFNLDIVEHFDAYQTESYLDNEFEEHYKYPFRSFVFYPRRKGYVCGTDYDIFKWTENEVQLCSFRLRIPKGIEEPEEADLLIGGPYRTEIKWETIPLTDELRKLDGQIVDCRYVDHHWVFVKERLDRNHPNGKSALLGKIGAQEHPVSREFLLTSLNKDAKFH